MDETQNSQFYDTDSASYDQARFRTTAGHRDHRHLMGMLMEAMAFMDLSNVIEVGVGTGRVTHALAEVGASKVRCVDISPEMLKTAETSKPEIEVNYTHGDAYDLPFGQGEFSSFVSVNLLTHLDDLETFWSEAIRVTSEGSQILVTTTRLDSIFFPFGLLANRRGQAFGQNVHTAWHTLSAHRKAIEAAGGRVESVNGEFYLPRALDRPPISTVLDMANRTLRKLPGTARARVAPLTILRVQR